MFKLLIVGVASVMLAIPGCEQAPKDDGTATVQTCAAYEAALTTAIKLKKADALSETAKTIVDRAVELAHEPCTSETILPLDEHVKLAIAKMVLLNLGEE